METLKNERGSILLYVTGSLVALMLFVGLVIDGGWTTYVRNQGQAAVDAAALSAASVIPKYQKGIAAPLTIELGATAFAQNALSLTSANTVMNRVPTLTLTKNIDCLAYNQKNNTFTCEDPGCTGTCARGQVNAVRVSIADSAKGNNAINTPLFFGKLVGMPSMRINASAVGYLGCPRKMRPDLPLAFCADSIDYPNQCGVRDALQASSGTNNSAFYAPAGMPASDAICRAFVNNPLSLPETEAGDQVNLNNGQLTNCLQAIASAFSTKKNASGEWCVFLPVFSGSCTSSFNQNRPVAGLAEMCITAVKATGSPKYVRGFLKCGDTLLGSGGGSCKGVSATNPILIR